MSRAVVIPAGGMMNAEYRALAPFGANRTPMLQLVVNALRESGEVSRIIAVAPPTVRKAITGVDDWLQSTNSGMENIRRGLQIAAQDVPALVCTSDLPLMEPEHVRDFVGRLLPDADVSVGLVTENELNRAFPDAPPSSFVTLRDVGPVTIGGLFQVHPGLLSRHERLLDRTFNARKAQWRMAGLLGPRLLWAWLRGTLTLAALVGHAEKRLGCEAQVLHAVAPELAFDIDTPDDYAYAQTRFS